MGEPRNIVFILADDLGWTDLGCYGSDYYETPYIDKLAAEGVRFTQAYAAAPLCSATRASILSGWTPARQKLHGVTPHVRTEDGGFTDYPGWESENQYRFSGTTKTAIPVQLGQFPLERVTFAEVLQNAGYRTGFFGKWHLGPDRDKFPEHQGFDVSVGATSLGFPRSYFAPYGNDGLADGPAGEYLTDRLTDEVEHFIGDCAQQAQPFLCCFFHYTVHGPLQAKQADVHYFSRKRNPNSRHCNPVYAAMVKSFDDSVGRVVETLERNGIVDDTLIIVYSDNGGVVGAGKPIAAGYERVSDNYPLRSQKARLFEGGIRVPLMIRKPGLVRSGCECPTPVNSPDFFPTLLEYAGVAMPQGIPQDGQSLMPLLTGESDFGNRVLTWFMPHWIEPGEADEMKPCAAIRQENYKLVKIFAGEELLFDLEDDIGEQHNLVAEQPERARELERLLMEELRTQNAAVPPLDPTYDPQKEAQVRRGHSKS